MLKDFCYWLESIEEDFPLPYEIKFVYFCLHKANNSLFLSYGGNEFEEKIVFNFRYYPLDAQYFGIQQTNFSLSDLRFLVEKMLEKDFAKILFEGKNVIVAIFGDTHTYFVKNN